MGEQSSFRDEMAQLCARHFKAVRHDPDAVADMLADLANAVSTTITIAAKGDPEMIDTLTMGFEQHVHETCVESSEFGALLALSRPDEPPQ